jgi:hypothetical protein
MPAETCTPTVQLPACDPYGAPYGHGLASTAAKLLQLARDELRLAGAAFMPNGTDAQRKARRIMLASDLLAVSGPYLDDGVRREDLGEIARLTMNASKATEILRAVGELPARAEEHVRRAVALGAAAHGVRRAAMDNPEAVSAAAVSPQTPGARLK